MKIEIKSEKSVFITIDKHTYYLDNSTNEQIMIKFKTNNLINPKTLKNGSNKKK
tara:strand:+ start:1256 stop:1417 length:162 start_codon:yes stop_codon:yes gene_type:complete